MAEPSVPIGGGSSRQDTVAGVGPLSHAIFRVARIHKMYAGQLLAKLGLYPGQELLMMRLWDQGPQRQVDLVRNLDSDAPTVNRSVRRLEQAGFVRRAPSPTDRRAAIIEATPASMSLRKEVQRVWSDLEALTAGDMSEAEQQQALTALNALEANLIAAPGQPSSTAEK